MESVNMSFETSEKQVSITQSTEKPVLTKKHLKKGIKKEHSKVQSQSTTSRKREKEPEKVQEEPSVGTDAPFSRQEADLEAAEPAESTSEAENDSGHHYKTVPVSAELIANAPLSNVSELRHQRNTPAGVAQLYKVKVEGVTKMVDRQGFKDLFPSALRYPSTERGKKMTVVARQILRRVSKRYRTIRQENARRARMDNIPYQSEKNSSSVIRLVDHYFDQVFHKGEEELPPMEMDTDPDNTDDEYFYQVSGCKPNPAVKTYGYKSKLKLKKFERKT